MTRAAVDIDFVGLPEVQELLGRFDERQVNNRMRRALRAGAKVVREEMRRQGKGGGFPARFAKTRTRNHRNPLGVSVSPQSPLSTVFEGGAGAHVIAPTRGLFLASGQGERPFFARGPVSHPGMAARPFIGPVFAASQDEAGDKAADVLFEGIER